MRHAGALVSRMKCDRCDADRQAPESFVSMPGHKSAPTAAEQRVQTVALAPTEVVETHPTVVSCTTSLPPTVDGEQVPQGSEPSGVESIPRRPRKKQQCGDDGAEDPYGFGSESVREAYDELGPAAFYAERGARYRNPHEEPLSACLSRALTEWEAAGHLTPADETPAPPPLGRVLDLACGSGEGSLALQRWADGRPGVAVDLEAADPFTFEAYESRMGCEAQRWSFEDVAGGVLAGTPTYDAVLCSFCLHLVERSWFAMTMAALARASRLLIVLTPHKRPTIDSSTGWEQVGEVLQERVRVRLYRSLVI